MADMKTQMLEYVVKASEQHKSEQNPLGYCYIPTGNEELATELHNEELIEALVTHRGADGSFPCRPTELGIKWMTAARPSAPQTFVPPPVPAPVPQQELPPMPSTNPVAPSAPKQHMASIAAIKVDTNVPVPPNKRFGRSAGGPSAVENFPFATLPVNASFFVPQDNPPKRDDDNVEIPKHRSFASVVSQANKKLHPKNFVIRAYKEPDGRIGARVWRTDDLLGERPTRARRTKLDPMPTQNYGGAMVPQQNGGGYPQQSGYDPNAGQYAPPPAPQGGGFMPPPPPQGGFQPPALPQGGFVPQAEQGSFQGGQPAWGPPSGPQTPFQGG